MPAWPDAPRIREFLGRAWRRLAALAVLRGASAGLLFSAGVILLTWRLGGRPLTAIAVAVALSGLAAFVAYLRATTSRANTALEIERRAPHCRNVVVTAAEILNRSDRVRDYIGARVCRDAARAIDRLSLAELFPSGRPAAALAGSALTCAGAFALFFFSPPARIGARTAVDVNAAALRHVEVRITPPAYTNLAARTERDPARLDVLEGSTLTVIAEADATAVTLETASSSLALTPAAPGSFQGTVTADRDGFLALQPTAPGGRAGGRQLIDLTVTPDRRPAVRITAPGRDLFLPNGRRSIDVKIEADDDLALDSLRLTYTKATGAGENFEFKTGDVPLTIAKTSDRQWIGSAAWALASLALEPGDMIVYRGVAADRRPGAAPVESDALLIEIVAPGAVAAEGFAIDDERDRYAFSQQMVILKTERLVAQRSKLAADAFQEEAMNIAALQRAVRAEFVFMMGGEIADEEIEAAGESELQEGRLENRGRTDILRAIRSMSRAATALTTLEMPSALTFERQAVTALQQAFSRDRYILRTLTTRERIDFERRLTGLLTDIARDARPPRRLEASPQIVTLRRVLADVAALSGRADFGASDAAAATAAAERLLRLDAGSNAVRAVATQLTSAAAAIRRADVATARATIDRALLALADATRATLPDAPAAGADPETRRLEGALADAVRKRGGR
jgi:hypothetical protein